VLSLAIDELTTTDWGHGMFLAEVSPEPDATRLKVAIGFCEPRTLDEALEVLARLRELTGALRWELGEEICRKRVPELAFDLAAPEVHDEET
jgi:hypothetical protein